MWRLQVVSLVSLYLATSSASVTWTQDNCNLAGSGGAVRGQVTDALCAKFSLCNNINNKFSDLLRRKEACDSVVYCLWRPELGQCGYNRDPQNNVCVPAEEVGNVNPNCNNITQGICPLNWQVKRECCADIKYDGKLVTQAPGGGWVCCNTPCQSLANSTRALPTLCSWADHRNVDQCGPRGRSLLGVDRKGQQHVPSLARSYVPDHVGAALGLAPAAPVGLGQIIPGFSSLGGLASYPLGGLYQAGLGVQTYSPGLAASLAGLPVLQQAGVSNKPKQTEEITVDDVMNLLIESLASDDDMFEYKAELNSDPWYGKQKVGGPGDSMKFVNPVKFINQLYSTPYGLTSGNWQAGAQNIPLPPPFSTAGAPQGYATAAVSGYAGGALSGYAGGIQAAYPGVPAAAGATSYLSGGSVLPLGFTLPTGGQPNAAPYQQQLPQQLPAYQQQIPSYQLPQKQLPTYQPAQQQQQPAYQPPPVSQPAQTQPPQAGQQQQQQPTVSQQPQQPYIPPAQQQQQPALASQLPQQPLPYNNPYILPAAQQQQPPAVQQQQLPYQPPQQPAVQQPPASQQPSRPPPLSPGSLTT